MYTTTSNLEQIFHNNIIVIKALTRLNLNIDVQVSILLLTVAQKIFSHPFDIQWAQIYLAAGKKAVSRLWICWCVCLKSKVSVS